jgi:lipid A 4'-phosphatase
MKFLAIALIIFFAAFSLFPEIDLKFSGLFYNEAEKFFLRENVITQTIYYSVRVFTVLILGICLFVIIYDYLKKKNIKLPLQKLADWKRGLVKISSKTALYLFLVIVITPGILVHNVFKPIWDRARPVNVKEFGGVYEFTPIYKLFAGQDGNSFPSGHASMAFAMIALIYAVSEKNRRKTLCLTTSYALIASLGRVMQGGHFLSDVIFSAIITLITIILLRKFMRF